MWSPTRPTSSSAKTAERAKYAGDRLTLVALRVPWSSLALLVQPGVHARERVRRSDRLLALVAAEPGLPVGEIARRLSVRDGTVYYHIARLQLAGRVRTVVKGRRRLVFPAGAAWEEMRTEAAALLRGRTVRHIALAILRQPGLSMRQLIPLVSDSPRAVYYHTKRLRAAGLIESATRTRYRNLEPTPLLRDLLPDLEREADDDLSDEIAGGT